MISIPEYLENPLFELPDCEIKNDQILTQLRDLFKKTEFFKFSRFYKVKRIISLLTDIGFISDTEVHTLYTLNKKAIYMNDNGNLYISCGVLLLRKSDSLFRLFIHEIAHLWLLNQKEYINILLPNKQFRKMYGDEEGYVDISPIEMNATNISIKIMKQLFYNKSDASDLKYLQAIDFEVEKLNKCMERIEELRGNRNGKEKE